MSKLVLIRHGESIWNKENRFTGWTDVPLSEKGVQEAQAAGKLLKGYQFHFDVAFTSVLKRATDTLQYVLEALDETVPVFSSWKLNERHYGALQGLNKDETKEKYGEEQVHLWRRSVDVRPPALTKEDERFPGNDLKYRDVDSDLLPVTENLVDTLKRVLSYYNEEIRPQLLEGKDVLIVAHGNSLRALIQHLENISNEDIMNLEIPTGKPYVYEFDSSLQVERHYYLSSKGIES